MQTTLPPQSWSDLHERWTKVQDQDVSQTVNWNIKLYKRFSKKYLFQNVFLAILRLFSSVTFSSQINILEDISHQKYAKQNTTDFSRTPPPLRFSLATLFRS